MFPLWAPEGSHKCSQALSLSAAQVLAQGKQVKHILLGKEEILIQGGGGTETHNELRAGKHNSWSRVA